MGAPATLPAARLRLEVHVGQRLLAQGASERAAERFAAVVAAAPDHPGAHYLLSRALLESGKILEGRDEAARAVESLGALPDERRRVFNASLFWWNLGRAEAAAAQLGAAETALARAAGLAPDHPGIRLALGQVLVRRGKDEEAVQELRRALRVGGPNATALSALGSALLRREDLEGARAALDEAIRLAPDDPEARYVLSALFRAQGDAARQEQELATFERLRASVETARVARSEVDALLRDAVSLMAEGKEAEAAPIFERALALPVVKETDYHHARLLTDLAHCRAAAGDVADAEALYREALALQPGAFTASFELGSLLARSGRLAEGVPPLVDAVVASPFDHAAHLNLGLAWGLLGRLNDSLAEIEKATILQPEDLRIRQLLVNLHWAIGHEERARRLAEVGGVKLPVDETTSAQDVGDVPALGWRE